MPSIYSSAAPEGRSALRWLRRLVIGMFVGVTLVALAFAWINWTGERAWTKVRTQLVARGEPMTAKQLMPPSIPEEQNLALIPLLAPLLDYELLPNGQHRWKDETTQKALVSGALFNIQGKRQGAAVPKQGKWQSGELTDLVAWQDYYAESAEFPHPPKPGTPGQDILMALGRDASAQAQLREGLKRPYCRFPVHFEEENTMAILLPHLAVLRRFANYFQLSALAHLSEKNSGAAWNDLEVCFRLLQGIEQEPILVSFLVRVALLQTVTQVIWEGAARDQWDAAALAKIQTALQSVDVLAHEVLALQGERGLMNPMYDRWISMPAAYSRDVGAPGAGDEGSAVSGPIAMLMPRGLLRQNQATHNLYIAQMIDALRAVRKPGGGYQPYDETEVSKALQGYLEPRSMKNFLVRQLAPAVEKAATRGLAGQARRDLALVAVALERYRLAKGRLPENLGELRPEWLSTIPDDLFTGAPFKYQRLAKGGFVLYSLGPNGRDDGGEWTPEAKGERKQSDLDDLVWKYPKE